MSLSSPYKYCGLQILFAIKMKLLIIPDFILVLRLEGFNTFFSYIMVHVIQGKRVTQGWCKNVKRRGTGPYYEDM